jgi:hypothetical protein
MNPPGWPPHMGIPIPNVYYPWLRPCPPPNPALGTWTYRSFVNNPDISKDFNDLEFGRGDLIIEQLAPGIFEGRLSFGDTYQFRLRGVADFSSVPCTVRFEGVGDTKDSKEQVYDYMGFFVPMWSNGVDQRPALVGSAVRTVAHNGGRARAGVVGSFIALKRDEETR